MVSFVTVHATYLSIIWSAKCQLYRPLKDYSHAWKIQKIGIQLIYYLSSYITKLLHMYFHRHTEVYQYPSYLPTKVASNRVE